MMRTRTKKKKEVRWKKCKNINLSLTGTIKFQSKRQKVTFFIKWQNVNIKFHSLYRWFSKIFKNSNIILLILFKKNCENKHVPKLCNLLCYYRTCSLKLRISPPILFFIFLKSLSLFLLKNLVEWSDKIV